MIVLTPDADDILVLTPDALDVLVLVVSMPRTRAELCFSTFTVRPSLQAQVHVGLALHGLLTVSPSLAAEIHAAATLAATFTVQTTLSATFEAPSCNCHRST